MASGFKIADVYAELSVQDNMAGGIAKARQALQTLGNEIKQVQGDFKLKAIDKGDAIARIRELKAEMATLQTSMQSAYATLGAKGNALDILDAKMGAGAGKATAFSMALMQLGSAADDAQYGFRGVLNNIPSIVSGLAQVAGASPAMAMGIAGGASIAATAIYQLINHWDEVKQVFGMPVFTDAIKELALLTEATDQATEAEKKRKEMREQMEKNKAMREEATPEAETAARARKEAIKKGGNEAVMAGIEMSDLVSGALDEKETMAAQSKAYAALPILAQPLARMGLMNSGIAQQYLAAEEQEIKMAMAAKRKFQAESLVEEATSTRPGSEVAAQKIAAEMMARPNNFKAVNDPAKVASALVTETEMNARNARKDEEDRQREMARATTGPNAEFNKQVGLVPMTQEQRREFKEKQVEHDDQMKETVERGYENQARERLGVFRRGKAGQKIIAGKNVTENEIASELISQGMGKNTANQVARHLLTDLEQSIDKEIEERATRQGISRDEARKRIGEDTKESHQRKIDDAQWRVGEAQYSLAKARQAKQNFYMDKFGPKFTSHEEYSQKIALSGFQTRSELQQLVDLQHQQLTALHGLITATQDQTNVVRNLDVDPISPD